MSFILTLVASSPENPLTSAHYGSFGAPEWLRMDYAADFAIDEKPDLPALRAALADDKIDIFVTAAQERRKKLLLADMDSTIVGEETLDELAGHAGIKEKIAEITTRAMRGDLDFHDALKERVGLLNGLDAKMLDKTLDETTINPGAKTLVQTMKAHGAICVLVSGGFTFFTAAIAKMIGFDFHHGNQLDIAQGKLTGKVIPPILDKDSKLDFLQHYAAKKACALSDAMTIGDGANDLPMLKAAGFGVGYHAKPLVVEALDNQIIHGDLTAALYAQGYKHSDFAA